MSLALLTGAAGPVAAAQADGQSIAQPGSGQTASQPGGQSVTQPAQGPRTVSQPGQCIAQSATGQALSQGSQVQAQGAGGSCAPVVAPLPIAVGIHLTHSKILRHGQHPGAARRHKTR